MGKKDAKNDFSQTYVGRNNSEESEKDCCSESLCLSFPTKLLHGRRLKLGAENHGIENKTMDWKNIEEKIKEKRKKLCEKNIKKRKTGR
ncbi:hypothetical protein CEXT_685901 [Caerostris extrusa]|uniref:Uncharacterized protein n=1 Tax=Caerostris extrusa TaxID=172846 RepID=A0AAV4Q4B4_CAEEX|nr:hypothetical protein CEXT_685901 [Caerostris extrusa]